MKRIAAHLLADSQVRLTPTTKGQKEQLSVVYLLFQRDTALKRTLVILCAKISVRV